MPWTESMYLSPPLNVFGSICVNAKGEVLLVHGKRSGKWSFPKGHRLNIYESAIDCATRELREETGIPAPKKYISCHKLQAAVYFLFTIEDDPEIKIQDTREIDKVTWWPLTNLPQTDCNVDVSMFRTLMKSLRKEQNMLHFLDSDYAHRRLSHIKSNMNNASMKSIATIS